jgi:pteridine reductase
VDLKGRVALVTGGGRRVGQALALALGAKGARVAVHFNASRAGAEETVARIVAAGGEARAFGADLASAVEAGKLVDTVAAEMGGLARGGLARGGTARGGIAVGGTAMGGLDILVNSAGIMERHPIGTVTPEAWDATFAVNLRAPFFTSQAAVPHMRGGGVIVNMADLAGFEAWTGYIPHGVSKAGVVALTRGLAHALGPAIRVNAVAPGAVLLPEHFDEAQAEHLRGTTPLKRLGSPDDVVKAVLYLIDADYVTGETLIVDGGRHVRA